MEAHRRGDRLSLAAPRPAAPYVSVGRRLRWSLVSGAASLVASVATVLVLSRSVDPREYGRVAVAIASWGLLFNSVDWCGNLLMRFGPVELREQGTLRVTVATRLVFAIPPLACLAVVAPLYLFFTRGGRGVSPLLVAASAAWIVVSTVHHIFLWCAVAAQRFGPLTVAGVVVKAAPLVPVLVAFLFHAPIFAESLVAAMLVGTLAGAVILYLSLGPLTAIARPDRRLLRSMWRYCRPALVGVPSLAVINWLDPLLLNHFTTSADVGRYQLAVPTLSVFGMLGAAVNSVLSPELVRDATHAQTPALARYRDCDQSSLALVAGLAAFAGACFAAPVMRAILPASYAQSADLVAILAVAGGFIIAFFTLHPLVTATDSVWSLQGSQWLQALVNLGLDVALVRLWGGMGVAIANVVAWAAAFVSLSLLLRRRVGAKVTAVWPLVAAAAGVTGLLVGHVGTGVRMVVGVALAAVSGVIARRAWQRRRTMEVTANGWTDH